jgi:hypothetical protein
MNSEMQTRKYLIAVGTTKMIRNMTSQFFDKGIKVSSCCDANIFEMNCPVRDTILVEKTMYN